MVARMWAAPHQIVSAILLLINIFVTVHTLKWERTATTKSKAMVVLLIFPPGDTFSHKLNHHDEHDRLFIWIEWLSDGRSPNKPMLNQPLDSHQVFASRIPSPKPLDMQQRSVSHTNAVGACLGFCFYLAIIIGLPT